MYRVRTCRALRENKPHQVSYVNSPLHRDELKEETIGTEGRRQQFLGTMRTQWIRGTNYKLKEYKPVVEYQQSLHSASGRKKQTNI